MNDHSNGNRRGATLADGSEKLLPDASAPVKRPMSLDGKEALDLYLAKIGANAEALNAQAALLQAALQERLDLLHELQSVQADDKQTRSR
jgi:hypothetical protein